MRLEWQIQIQYESTDDPNGPWRTHPSGRGFKTKEAAEKFIKSWVHKGIRWRVVPDGPDPELDDTVLVLAVDEPYIGTVVEVNDKDQGPFEYYVMKDSAHSSYWDRESIAVLEWLRAEA